MTARPLRIGHRGVSSRFPANSLAAFRAAAAEGLDGVELDVHTAADGALVVHHDPEIPGVGPIARLPASAIRGARLANGEPIPTLAEALEVLGSLRVFIELKAIDERFDDRLIECLEPWRSHETLAIHSFDHRLIARIRRRVPWLPGGVLSVSYPVDPAAELGAALATWYWMIWPMIDEALVRIIHQAGGKVVAWTVDDRAAASRLAGLGVDGLCGNYPERLAAD